MSGEPQDTTQRTHADRLNVLYGFIGMSLVNFFFRSHGITGPLLDIAALYAIMCVSIWPLFVLVERVLYRRAWSLSAKNAAWLMLGLYISDVLFAVMRSR